MAKYYSNSSNGYQLVFEVNQTSQDTGANKSYLSWKLTITTTNSYYQNENTKDYFYASINGKAVYDGNRAVWFSGYNSSVEIASGKDFEVEHNPDGSKTVALSFSYSPGKTASYYPGWMGGDGNFKLTDIPRGATLAAAPNFTDEDNPKITYSNPAGTAATTLQACIATLGTDGLWYGTEVAYRDIPKNETSYTFNLTSAERTALRKKATGNTLDVKFYVKTTIGSNSFYSSLAKTMTITNGNPTLNPTVVDSNATTKALTGDANKLVKYYSNAAYTIGAAALKESTLKSQKVTHNGVTKTTATGTFNAVENASFTFSATDSRGNTTTKTITKTLINYVKLTCNHKESISAEGVATININGNYFNGSFGTTANTLTVQYRYKINDYSSTYGAWTTVTATKSGNTYEATIEVPGLNYQSPYMFQCRAIDKLATVEADEKAVKALPVFDWGENDFHIHGDLIVEGTITGSNATGAVVLEDGEVVNVGTDYVIANGITTVDGFTWGYRKWNGGTYECWGVSNIATAINTTWGGLYVSGYIAATDKKFPITFAEVPNVNATLSGNGSGAFLLASGSGAASTTSTGIYEIARGTALTSAGTFKINYQVIGKWK